MFFNLFSIDLSRSHGFIYFLFQPLTLYMLEMESCNFFLFVFYKVI